MNNRIRATQDTLELLDIAQVRFDEAPGR